MDKSPYSKDKDLKQQLAAIQYAWDHQIQGRVTGSFFWGYWLTQIPGGWLSERYGGKRFFGWATFGCGVITLLIPLAADIGYWALICLRVGLGLLQGVAWPAMFVIWSQWAPPLERQKLASLCYSGSTFGIVLTFPTVGMLCAFSEEGWVYVFYISGTLTILWCFLWYYYVFDSPSQHPRITILEKEYIQKCLEKTLPEEETHRTPWVGIASSPAVWAYIVSHMASTFQLYGLLSYMTTYLKDVHYFSDSEAARNVAIPYIGFFASYNIAAVLYDMVITRKLSSADVARKIFNSIGFVVPGVLLIYVGFLDCTQSTMAMTCLLAVNTISGVQFGAGFLLNLHEIAPQHTGVLFGISNTFATFSGLISLKLASMLTANRLRSGWQITFLITSAIFIFSTVVFILFGSTKLQKWAKSPEDRLAALDAASVVDENTSISERSVTA